MEKWTFIMLSMIATSYLIVGCGGGDWKAPVDTIPKLWQKEISTKEYNQNIIPVTNFCKNATKIVLNLNWLPSYYSLQNNTLKIDLSNVDVPDGNRKRIIPVTCINWNNKVDWNITSKEIDSRNDSPTIITNSNLPTNINVWEDYNASITAKDNDWWIESASYKIINKDNNTTVEEWDMSCTDSNNTSICNISIPWLSEWNYTTNIAVDGIIGGEHPQSEKNITQNFNVNAVNHAPKANPDSASTDYEKAVVVDVLSNDSDQDGDTLTIASVWSPSNGIATIENGKIKYTPENWFSGTDSFEYTVSDGEGGEDTAKVTVTVKEKINHAPTLNSVFVSGNTLIDEWVYNWKHEYSISKNVDHDITFTANWSDVDWDTLKIIVNWIEYNWNSYTETLNLANNEEKEFSIKEYDWKEYSNEKIILIYWR